MANSTQSFYDVLAVPMTADTDTIKLSYRKLIRQYHPDVAGDAGIRMTQLLNEAWDTLRDDSKRRDYDLTLVEPEPVTEPAKKNKQSRQQAPAADTAGSWYEDTEWVEEPIPDSDEPATYREYNIDNPDKYVIRNNTLVYDEGDHKLMRIIAILSVSLIVLITWGFSQSLQWLSGDLFHAPFRSLVFPLVLILELVIFLSRRRRTLFFASIPWVWVTFTGPIGLFGLKPWADLAANFHWWETAAMAVLGVLIYIAGPTYRQMRRYARTKKLLAS